MYNIMIYWTDTHACMHRTILYMYIHAYTSRNHATIGSVHNNYVYIKKYITKMVVDYVTIIMCTCMQGVSVWAINSVQCYIY